MCAVNVHYSVVARIGRHSYLLSEDSVKNCFWYRLNQLMYIKRNDDYVFFTINTPESGLQG